eukprot:TRINITY_DN11443_c0_g1_i1.p1 TRINITY_DN11443_c0_g1~~TRINITY_DN11443_c0_g1_i1.p1  ORF type:complete len:366 (+),score=86.08 TRINITY_DN11443_c0_g1_i1:138-1235(+)
MPLTLSKEATEKYKEAVESPDHAGFLEKKTSKGKGWLLRWFFLKDGHIFYCTKEKGKPNGIINLHNAIVESDESWPFSFTILAVKSISGSKKWNGRTYLLAGKSQEDRDGWLEALSKVRGKRDQAVRKMSLDHESMLAQRVRRMSDMGLVFSGASNAAKVMADKDSKSNSKNSSKNSSPAPSPGATRRAATTSSDVDLHAPPSSTAAPLEPAPAKSPDRSYSEKAPSSTEVTVPQQQRRASEGGHHVIQVGGALQVSPSGESVTSSTSIDSFGRPFYKGKVLARSGSISDDELDTSVTDHNQSTDPNQSTYLLRPVPPPELEISGVSNLDVSAIAADQSDLADDDHVLDRSFLMDRPQGRNEVGV